MADLISASDVTDRKLLRRPDLAELITDASAAIETACNRTFAQAALTEAHDGHNRPRLFLLRPPVVSVDTVTINGDPLDNSLGNAWGFDPETGELWRGDGQSDPRFQPWFPRGQANVVVGYTGGYAPIPYDLRRACLIQVKYLADVGRTTGLYKSEKIGDYSYELADGGSGMPDAVRQIIARYVL